MVRLSVVGLNCGTSIDGVDVAHCIIESVPDSNDVRIKLVSYCEYPVPTRLCQRVLSLCRAGAKTTFEEVCDLNFELGDLFAEAVLSSKIDLEEVDIVASHGQTLWHTPFPIKGEGFENGERRMATLQMAESSVISKRTTKTVINDFRVAELAHGRMGAPLSGFFEASLLRDTTKLRLCQNIGGMGNVTVIPSLSSMSPTTYDAFDTGPGNVLIDAAVRILTDCKYGYDLDGKMGLAGEGEIDCDWIASTIESEPYYTLSPPKTTGREHFGDDMAASLVRDLRNKGISANGIVANITQLTSEVIARAYEAFVVPYYGAIGEIYVCGGGANNPNLMRFIERRFPEAKVARLDEAESGSSAGVPAAAKEAILFALLGFLCVSGRAVSVAKGEACKDEAIIGKVTPGKNYLQVMREALKVSNSGPLGRSIIV